MQRGLILYAFVVITAVVFLTGCNNSKQEIVAGSCAVFQPIWVQTETKTWLRGNRPWPTGVSHFLKEVGDHNEIWCDLCVRKDQVCKTLEASNTE
jgi:hypothetical protein